MKKGYFLSNLICDLVKTEYDTYKYPNVIKDDDIAKKLFTEGYILIMEKVIENAVSELFLATRNDIQKQRR